MCLLTKRGIFRISGSTLHVLQKRSFCKCKTMLYKSEAFVRKAQHGYARRILKEKQLVFFSLGYKQSVQKTQWQIYKARKAGEIKLVHALQEHLCNSFCAKLLATEYAIIDLQLNWRHMCTNSLGVTPLTLVPLFLENKQALERKVYFTCGKDQVLKEKTRLSKKDYTHLERQSGRKKLVLEDCKILVARSLWNRKKIKGCQDCTFLRNILRGDKNKWDKKHNKSLIQMIYKKAEQIHAFLALEPEWQAVFSNSTPKSDQIIEQIRVHTTGPSPQFVFVASIRDCLDTINHKVLIKSLHTFKSMEDRLKDWLQAGILRKEGISKSDQDIKSSAFNAKKPDLHKSKSPSCAAGSMQQGTAADHHCWFVSTNSLLFRKNHEIDSSSFVLNVVSQHFFYSCFPKVLWKERSLVNNATQIEDYAYKQDHVITQLLLRVMFYTLTTGIKEFAKRFAPSSLQYKVISKQTFYNYVCDPTMLRKAVAAKKQYIFCTGDWNHFIIMSPSKRFLQMCLLHGKQYLPDLADCVNSRHVSKDIYLNKNVPSSLAHRQECSLREIKDCRQGFVLLGFQFIQIARKNLYVCKVAPSKGGLQSLIFFVRDQIKQNQSASTNILIAKLNLLLCRWVEYYKSCEYTRSYKKISYLIWEKVHSWLSRRNRRK